MIQTVIQVIILVFTAPAAAAAAINILSVVTGHNVLKIVLVLSLF